MTIASALGLPAHWLANLILLQSSAGGLLGVACIAIAMQWFNVVTYVPSNFSWPLLSALSKSGNQKNTQRTIAFVTIVSVGIAGLLASIIAFTASSIVMIYGPAYPSAAVPMTLMACAAIFHAGSVTLLSCLLAFLTPWIGVWANGVAAVTLVAVAWLLQSDGPSGVAIAHLLSQGARMVVCLIGWAAINVGATRDNSPV